MTSELICLLKVNGVLAIFYFFYCIFLQKETFYASNRYYFLLTVLLAFLFPIIDFSGLFSSQQVQNFQQMAPHIPINVSGKEADFTLIDIALILIIFGIGVMLTRLGIQLVSLWKIHAKSSDGSTFNQCRIRNMDTITNPFSFFQTIYINPKLHNKEDLNTILKHEAIHAKQWHSFDILMYEIVYILFWYNPFVWLLKQAVRQNIEFFTDKEILKAGYDKRQYQHELLKVSQIPTFLKIANNFNFNHLKKRITMMNKKNSNRLQYLKFTLVIPMFAGMSLLANNNVSLNSKDASAVVTITQEGETVVVNEKAHDFGTIKESAGNVTAVFTITNKGKEPLVINNVKASCGCTTPEWTKEPIAPGQQGHVKATYGAAGRPGPFDKTVTVETNGNPKTLELHIKGTVVQN